MSSSIPADQERGLYRKYRVERADGSSGPGGKHEHCEYYVLDFVHDKHAIPAMRAYAESCKGEFPELAADLIMLVDEYGRSWDHHHPVDGKK